jgi:hypothetical protein
VVRELIRRLGYQDFARRRRALQARGGVDSVAGHRVGSVGGRADPTRDHRAGIDPDAQREWPPHPALPAEIQYAHPVAHQEGRAQAALGIVLVRARGPEDGHHRIAHELLDKALVALDRRSHLAEEVGLDRAHFLGIESFAEGREPDQVREQDGDGAAVTLGRSGCRGRGRGSAGEPGSALGAKGEIGGRLEATTATGHMCP